MSSAAWYRVNWWPPPGSPGGVLIGYEKGFRYENGAGVSRANHTIGCPDGATGVVWRVRT